MKFLLFVFMATAIIFAAEVVMKLSGTEANLGYSVGIILHASYVRWFKD